MSTSVSSGATHRKGGSRCHPHHLELHMFCASKTCSASRHGPWPLWGRPRHVFSRLARAGMTAVQVCAHHTFPTAIHRKTGRNSRHAFNTKAVSRKIPQNTVSISYPRLHSGIVKTRDAPLTRFDTGVQHTEKACATGGARVGWGGSQRPQVRFPPPSLFWRTWTLAVKRVHGHQAWRGDLRGSIRFW
jgi:hypothetical protein